MADLRSIEQRIRAALQYFRTDALLLRGEALDLAEKWRVKARRLNVEGHVSQALLYYLAADALEGWASKVLSLGHKHEGHKQHEGHKTSDEDDDIDYKPPRRIK